MDANACFILTSDDRSAFDLIKKRKKTKNAALIVCFCVSVIMKLLSTATSAQCNDECECAETQALTSHWCARPTAIDSHSNSNLHSCVYSAVHAVNLFI